VKTNPAPLQAHKGLSSTTVTLCLLIGPLPDNSYRGMTELDRDVVYDDTGGIIAATRTPGSFTYKARIGSELSALSSTADLGVDNAETSMLPPFVGAESEGFTVAQINAGDLDRVPYVVYKVNYNDLTAGRHEIVCGGYLGEIRRKVGDLQVGELRSLSQILKQVIVELDSRTCRAKFGSVTGVDARQGCDFDVSTLWVSGSVQAVGTEDDREFTDATLTQDDDYFSLGVLEWLTGVNAGQKMEVESFAAGSVALLFPTVNPIQLGDTYRVRPDCTKMHYGHNSCRTWWGSQWTLHFRGEPYIPVGDAGKLSVPGSSGSIDTPVVTTDGDPGTTSGGGTSGGTGLPLPLPGDTYPSTTRTRGTTVVDPVTYGADPTGATDSTAAFNAAYAALPASGGNQGGIVRPSAGTYLIDPDTSVQPLSYTLLDLQTHDVTLVESYTAVDHKYGVLIQDKTQVEIAGGKIVGYRNKGPVPGGTTAEWGHCIACYGSSHVTIRDITLREAMGDGISLGGHAGVGCTDIVIDNIIATQNRRQGLSIVWATGVVVTDSEFSYTNGTSPECGIDIEPEAGEVANTITIQNCHLTHNHKFGLNVEQRSGAGTINGVTVANCTVDYQDSNGIVVEGPSSNVTIQDSTVEWNSATGIVLNLATNPVTIKRETFSHNYSRNTPISRSEQDITGQSSLTAQDILVKGGSSTAGIGTNHYLAQ